LIEYYYLDQISSREKKGWWTYHLAPFLIRGREISGISFSLPRPDLSLCLNVAFVGTPKKHDKH